MRKLLCSYVVLIMSILPICWPSAARADTVFRCWIKNSKTMDYGRLRARSGVIVTSVEKDKWGRIKKVYSYSWSSHSKKLYFALDKINHYEFQNDSNTKNQFYTVEYSDSLARRQLILEFASQGVHARITDTHGIITDVFCLYVAYSLPSGYAIVSGNLPEHETFVRLSGGFPREIDFSEISSISFTENRHTNILMKSGAQRMDRWRTQYFSGAPLEMFLGGIDLTGERISVQLDDVDKIEFLKAPTFKPLVLIRVVDIASIIAVSFALLWLFSIVFLKDLREGLLSLFFIPALLYFALKYWRLSKIPFLILAGGLGLILLSLILGK